uniref:G-protein coupled receptors family 1 profile domain-containing protein n=1 Tax=Clytia hemisphaerica TaxID=252671 RepID=A0A7M5XK53_9CNID
MSRNVGNPTCGADSWAPPVLSITTGICCFVIAVVATIGNGLIIVAVIADPLKKLRNPFNYFLINLAVADFIMGSISMPLCVYTHYLEYKVMLEPIVNNILRMSYFISGMASLISLITLTIDRYIAISRAIKYRLYFSWKRCIFITAIIWTISIAFPFIYFKVGAVEYYFVFACVAILTSFVVLVIIIIQMNKLFRRQSRVMTAQLPSSASSDFQRRRLVQEKRLTRTYLLVIVFFILLYLPGVAMTFMLYFWKILDCVPDTFYGISNLYLYRSIHASIHSSTWYD